MSRSVDRSPFDWCSLVLLGWMTFVGVIYSAMVIEAKTGLRVGQTTQHEADSVVSRGS